MSYSSPHSAGQPRPRRPVEPTPGPGPNPLPEPTPGPRPNPLPEPTPGPRPNPLPEPTPGPRPNPLPEPTPGPGSTPGPGVIPRPNDATVKIPVGYSGIISGLSRSHRTQNAVVAISAADGRRIFQSILIGFGENKPMTEEIDPNSTGIAFGPFSYGATVTINIKNASLGGRDFRPSTVIPPITVTKAPSAAHPNHIRVTTILSEDDTDNDFNDAIISIFAFKSAS